MKSPSVNLCAAAVMLIITTIAEINMMQTGQLGFGLLATVAATLAVVIGSRA